MMPELLIFIFTLLFWMKQVNVLGHWQLPPTVLSYEAACLGFNRSILEIAIKSVNTVFLLNTQYRMKEVIAGFSSNYFYNNQLLSPAHLQNTGEHITFIDTAGSGYQEEH